MHCVMKTTYLISALIFTACGTAPTIAIDSASDTTSAAQSAKTKLTKKRIDLLTTAYQDLIDPTITGQRIAALAADATFVEIDVSNPLRSASYGHTTAMLIPSGVTGRPSDPNLATSFYVRYGASTNRPGGVFGPFVLTANNMSMSAARMAQLVVAMQALPGSAYDKVTEVGPEALFAEIDATPAHRSRSFGHTITVLVPAGTTADPTDPDLSTTYYVRFGQSTNAPGGIYGPFGCAD